ATTWNQNWPYNELCPADGGGPGGHAYAGCVATAMAQVMKYWSNPIQGTGSHDYTHYIYGNLFADFGATTYDWANMPHSISSSNTPIATLMYHCGVAVEMSYGASGSGANLDGYHGACNALKNYFKFDLSAYHDSKYKYEDSTWQNMLRNELDNGRPMLYSGMGVWTGHAWNLDGYEAVGELYHYHMNWGWGGSYNGYYYLDDLTPGSHNYFTGQEAIFNLYPYAANLVSCYPQNTDYWTGTTNPSSKTETSLVFGTDPEDGWMSFDISAIPDGSTIYAVSFNGHVYERHRPNWSITPVSSDPVTAGAGVLHADIVAEQSSGYYFHHDETNINYPVDWRAYMLEGDICADVQSSLSSDKFTVGIANNYLSYTRYIRFDGWNEANPPFLNIYYAAYGNIEGYVFEDGSTTPIENVYVSIRQFTDTTDSNGYYLIEDVPIGSYQVSVDANDQLNANDNPFFNDTIIAVINDGITTQLDFGLKWAEIVLSPAFLEIPIDPFEIKTDSFTITNNGPGDLDYFCYVEPPMGDTLANFDIETPSGDITLYGCEFDGTYVWATGPVSSGGDHQLYKFDKDGNLISQYSQGTTSQWGMRKMTFDGAFLYSCDYNGFYRIDPGDGSVTTLFTDYPDGLSSPDGITWVPGLGFVSNDNDEDFFVFDETGALVTRLTNSDENYYSDMTYDNVNDCLWLVYGPAYTIYQYDLETESLTGLSWLLPDLDDDGYQSANGVCFSTSFV
ncbi:MAG: C10 family peptidase, partial [Bacteroidales bacterium]|nr:C10 family peptidase [Bacteroidales bacterium]